MAKNNYREQYDQIIEKIEAFKLDLNDLYSIKDLENREFKFRQLKDKYGGGLDVYYNNLKAELQQVKTVLSSKYIHRDPYASTSGFATTEYSNEFKETGPFGIIKSEVNPDYDETFDLNSEWNNNRRQEEGVTLEDDINSRNQSELNDSFTFTNHTDAWGRDYDHPDFGIDPSSLNRTTVTPDPVVNNNDNKNDNNNNEVIEEDTNEVINNNNNTTNLGAEDGDLIAVNTNNNNNQEETPNRLELMTKEIADNPSRIQQGLIESGFTPERLAKLKIKHQDWKAERRNRRNLQVEATT